MNEVASGQMNENPAGFCLKSEIAKSEHVAIALEARVVQFHPSAVTL